MNERKLIKVEELLEQHDHYDVGDGFSISRRPDSEWGIYYKGKHLDCWDAEHAGNAIPDNDDLIMFPSAITAFKSAVAIKPLCKWTD